MIKDKIIRVIRTLFEQKSNGYQNSNLSLDQYLNKIKPYLKNIIVDLQSSYTWQIQLTIAINFISSKDTEEERVMYSTSDDKWFAPYHDANEVVNELMSHFVQNIKII